MRNDATPWRTAQGTTAQWASKHRAALARRPDAREALRAGYIDGMTTTGPWPASRTLGPDVLQQMYAIGRHMVAVAKARPGRPPEWPEHVIFPTRLQDLLNATVAPAE